MRNNKTRNRNLVQEKMRKMVNDKLRVKMPIHQKNFKQAINPLRKAGK